MIVAAASRLVASPARLAKVAARMTAEDDVGATIAKRLRPIRA
jgi:pilus assembly protein TadC